MRRASRVCHAPQLVLDRLSVWCRWRPHIRRRKHESDHSLLSHRDSDEASSTLSAYSPRATASSLRNSGARHLPLLCPGYQHPRRVLCTRRSSRRHRVHHWCQHICVSVSFASCSNRLYSSGRPQIDDSCRLPSHRRHLCGSLRSLLQGLRHERPRRLSRKDVRPSCGRCSGQPKPKLRGQLADAQVQGSNQVWLALLPRVYGRGERRSDACQRSAVR